MSIKLNGATSGSVELDVPDAIGSDIGFTLPGADGSTGQVLATNGAGALSFETLGGPTFKAIITSNQSISNSVNTKVSFDSLVFDTDSDYSTANYRFTPSKAGYYSVTSSIYANYSTSQYSVVVNKLYKNGSETSRSTRYVSISAGEDKGHIVLTDLIYMNGSTDYLEVYVYSTAGGPYVEATQTGSFFTAHWVHS